MLALLYYLYVNRDLFEGNLNNHAIDTILKRTKATLQGTILPGAFVFLLLTSFGPCEESLPLYQEPERVLQGTVEGAYILSITDNSMRVYLTIKNNFDETLEGVAVLKGTVEIVSARDPSVTKTGNLSAANLISAGSYNSRTGMLRLDPGQTIRLGFAWNLVSDRGRNLPFYFFKYIQDLSCEKRCLAYTEDFILKAELTVFPKTGPVVAPPVVYPFCYVSRYIAKSCPPIITTAPCNLRPPQLAPVCFPFEVPDSSQALGLESER